VQVDFRAAQITSFLKEVVKTVSDIDSSLDVGAYVLPFAASADGYYGNTQSGNDYSQYTDNWIKIMPMVPTTSLLHRTRTRTHRTRTRLTMCAQVYWQDWATADNFYDWVNQTIFYANHLTKVCVAVLHVCAMHLYLYILYKIVDTSYLLYCKYINILISWF
jgi:hypothetical protein